MCKNGREGDFSAVFAWKDQKAPFRHCPDHGPSVVLDRPEPIRCSLSYGQRVDEFWSPIRNLYYSGNKVIGQFFFSSCSTAATGDASVLIRLLGIPRLITPTTFPW